MYRHILIPTDGSELAEHGVTNGLALAKALEAKVSVIVVEEPFDELRFIEVPGQTEESAKYAKQSKKHATNVLNRPQMRPSRPVSPATRFRWRTSNPIKPLSLQPRMRLRPHRHVIAWAQRTLRGSARQCDKQGADAHEKPRTSLSLNVRAAR
jgi:hypothetical protein